jgi:hypothetical protein
MGPMIDVTSRFPFVHDGEACVPGLGGILKGPLVGPSLAAGPYDLVLNDAQELQGHFI